MIGKAIALYALWRVWRTRNVEPSLLALQLELDRVRAQRRDAVMAMANQGRIPSFKVEREVLGMMGDGLSDDREPLVIPWAGSPLPYDSRTQRLIW